MIRRWMLCAWAAALLVAAGTPLDFPDTPAGRRGREWLETFRMDDDAKARAWMQSAWTPEALAHRSVDDRLQGWRQLRQDLGALTLEKIAASEPNHIELVLSAASGGSLRLTLDVQPEPPHRIVSTAARVSIGGDDGPPEPPMASTPIAPAALPDSIARLMESLQRSDEFSGVVYLVVKGRVVFSRAVGEADRRWHVPNRIDTRFNLGSINKAFTQVAIGQLVDQGKLAFSDPLSNVLPDYPKDIASKITIQQLLDHRSGLGDFFGERFDQANKGRFRAIADFLPLFQDQPLEFEPGAKQRYSNAGYIVLGAVIEKLSGQSYADYVRQHVFTPAGMTRTDAYEADLPIEGVAMGYTRNDGPDRQLRENIYSRPARGGSAGGGYSTAEDMVRFARALSEGKLLGPESMKHLYGGAPPAFGIAGGAPGLNAALELAPEHDAILVVLSNLDPPSAEQMARRVRALMRRSGIG